MGKKIQLNAAVAVASFVIGLGALAPPVHAGPVILVGHDADDHGFQAVYAGIFDQLLANTTNSQSGIVSVGTSAGTKAGNWIQQVAALMTFPQAVTHVKGSVAIAAVDLCGFAIIAVPSDSNDTPGGITQLETTAFAARAADVANFINGGGGLFGQTGDLFTDAYGYMGVFASITSFGVPANGDCGAGTGDRFDNVTTTTEGLALGITDTNVDGCCFHNTFTGFAPFLNTLATATEPFCDPNVDGQAVYIGCLDCSIPPQKQLEPVLDFNPIGTMHTVTATLLDDVAPFSPIAGVGTSFEVTSGPNMGTLGGPTATDGAGQASFTYTDTGGPGVDEIVATCLGGLGTCANPGSGTITSNTVLKFWDDDCNNNGIPDTCDISCDGFSMKCMNFMGCGGSADINNDGVPDECAVCGNNLVEPGEDCDPGVPVAGDCCTNTCTFEAVATNCDTDKDLCSGEQCDAAGICQPFSPGDVICAGANPPCESGEECNPDTGGCELLPDPSGNACDTDSSACTPEVCDGTGFCGPDPLNGPTDCTGVMLDVCNDAACDDATGLCTVPVAKPTSTLCRAGSGDVCDPDEFCTGTDGAPCPLDTITPSTTVCNPGSGDLCDPDEFCTGQPGAVCPGDTIEPGTTVCNPGSGDVCDPDEFCPGVADAGCPADVVAPGTTVCNPGSGDVCDPDEFCTGLADQACPPDSFDPGTLVCNAGSGDLCDPDELCPGVADGGCPADVVEPSTTVCNPGSKDVCDLDELCTGVAGAPCPPDVVAPTTTVCNPGSGDLCDPDEFCSGVADDPCPGDTITGAGTVCNPGSGDSCDPDEVCSGIADDPCPADTITGAGTVCNPGSGDSCDADEVCSGVADDPCPADVIAGAGTVCNPGSGDSCDPDEVCSGVADDPCPADTIAGAGTVCDPGSGDLCDPDEVCSGVADDPCPADVVAGAGTVCNPGSGDSCDPDEVCSGVMDDPCPADSFDDGSTICLMGSGDVCDPDEFCPGVADGACPTDSFDDGSTVCRTGSGDVCDPDEFCTGTAGDPCPGDVVAPSTTVCNPSTGVCDPTEFCSGNVGESCPADTMITNCIPGDGCCAPGCNANNDTDCDPVCGNGVLEPTEECEDGNTDDGDGCNSLCMIEGVPTVSTWGLLILALLLATAGKVHFRRQELAVQ